VRGGEDESVLPPDDSPPLSDDADSAAKARSRADRTELAQGMDNNGSTRVTAARPDPQMSMIDLLAGDPHPVQLRH